MKEVKESMLDVSVLVGIAAEDKYRKCVEVHFLDGKNHAYGIRFSKSRARFYGEMLMKCAEEIEADELFDSEAEEEV